MGALAIALGMISCQEEGDGRMATGVFEATEITLSAEAMGTLKELNLREGDVLKKGQVVGYIDTTQLHLSKLLLGKNQQALLSNKPDIQPQIEATEREITKAKDEKARIEKLVAGEVATQKQLDDINAQIDILEARLKAQKSSLNNSSSSIDQQSEGVDIQRAQIEDQIQKSVLTAPMEGTVLVTYTNAGELASPGRALYKMADLKNVYLKAYVTVDQLSQLSLHQKVTVLAESGAKENVEYPGEIIWISSQSEFTPKTIQTQDERANQVYAIKIAIKNDGFIKLGMYGGFKL
ncbi:MAG: HlyD family efflux transporter periplasmic adaptor subunit [Schleiferiaceae bacterium]